MFIICTSIQTFSDTNRKILISQELLLLATISLILMTFMLDSAR